MCGLFGFADYGGSWDRFQKNRAVAVLAGESEERGRDAAGIAYLADGRLSIYKRPLPAHKMTFKVPSGSRTVMGHTRMTTQGKAKFNPNNHPFPGRAGGTSFALAHNGVLYNDLDLRRTLRLPQTRIATDSYIAVQLLEREKALNFQTLAAMAERVEGSFAFTLLDDTGSLWFVKGDSPLAIRHFPERGLYLYASTDAILDRAVQRLCLKREAGEKVLLCEGEILRIDPQGEQAFGQFEMYRPRHRKTFQDYSDRYLDALIAFGGCCGVSGDEILLLRDIGYSEEEIEELLYDLPELHISALQAAGR